MIEYVVFKHFYTFSVFLFIYYTEKTAFRVFFKIILFY
jgi:hypothetical protein